jgi:hypothetical protein
MAANLKTTVVGHRVAAVSSYHEIAGPHLTEGTFGRFVMV